MDPPCSICRSNVIIMDSLTQTARELASSMMSSIKAKHYSVPEFLEKLCRIISMIVILPYMITSPSIINLGIRGKYYVVQYKGEVSPYNSSSLMTSTAIATLPSIRHSLTLLCSMS
jgi:hypothetical protein